MTKTCVYLLNIPNKHVNKLTYEKCKFLYNVTSVFFFSYLNVDCTDSTCKFTHFHKFFYCNNFLLLLLLKKNNCTFWWICFFKVQRTTTRMPCSPRAQPAVRSSSPFLLWASQDCVDQSWGKLFNFHFYSALSQWWAPGPPQKPAPLCLWDWLVRSWPPQLCVTQLAFKNVFLPCVLDYWWGCYWCVVLPS